MAGGENRQRGAIVLVPWPPRAPVTWMVLVIGDSVSGSRSVDPGEDNLLKITGDGRRAALDLRLVGAQPDPDGGKIRAAADRNFLTKC